jgi:hypothetical protein
MVNSVLSSLPTFFMSTMKVPIEVLNQIDIYRRHCLWRGGDLNAKKPPLASWKMVWRQKRKVAWVLLNFDCIMRLCY